MRLFPPMDLRLCSAVCILCLLIGIGIGRGPRRCVLCRLLRLLRIPLLLSQRLCGALLLLQPLLLRCCRRLCRCRRRAATCANTTQGSLMKVLRNCMRPVTAVCAVM